MANLDEPSLTVELEQTGQVHSNFLSYSLNSEFTVVTDGWEFVVYSEDDPRGLRRKFQPLQPVKLYIDDQLQVIGRIDRTSPVGESGKALRVEGRDYLADIAAGSVERTLRFTKDSTLETAILKICDPYGISKVTGSNVTRNLLTGKSRFNKKPPADFSAARLEEFKPDDNDGALELVNRIVARHGFMVQPAGSRAELVVSAPDFDQDPLYQLTRPGNILRGAASRDYSEVPTVTVAVGRQVIPGRKADPILSEMATVAGDSLFGANLRSLAGGTTDRERIVRKNLPIFGADSKYPIGRNAEVQRVAGSCGGIYRPLFYTDKKSRNADQVKRGINRQISDRLRKTLEYSCTVRGHRDPATGALYAVDTIAQIQDDIEDVNEPMWCVERTFKHEEGAGPATDMLFLRLGSISL